MNRRIYCYLRYTRPPQTAGCSFLFLVQDGLSGLGLLYGSDLMPSWRSSSPSLTRSRHSPSHLPVISLVGISLMIWFSRLFFLKFLLLDIRTTLMTYVSFEKNQVFPLIPFVIYGDSNLFMQKKATDYHQYQTPSPFFL